LWYPAAHPGAIDQEKYDGHEEPDRGHPLATDAARDGRRLRQGSRKNPQDNGCGHGQADRNGGRKTHALENRTIALPVITEHDEKKRQATDATEPIQLTGRKEHQRQSGSSHSDQ
jgi:hypothetical protein